MGAGLFLWISFPVHPLHTHHAATAHEVCMHTQVFYLRPSICPLSGRRPWGCRSPPSQPGPMVNRFALPLPNPAPPVILWPNFPPTQHLAHPIFACPCLLHISRNGVCIPGAKIPSGGSDLERQRCRKRWLADGRGRGSAGLCPSSSSHHWPQLANPCQSA